MSTRKQNNKIIERFDNAILELDKLKFKNIKDLLLGKFNNKKNLFDLKKNLKDEFIESEQKDPLYFYNWYKQKNASFRPIGITNPSLPEMDFLLANIAKDLIILFITKSFYSLTNKSKNKLNYNMNTLKRSLQNTNYISENKKQYYIKKWTNNLNRKTLIANNTVKMNDTLLENIKKLLNDLNDVITNNYKYLEIQKLYLDVLEFFSPGSYDCYRENITILNENTPFIIFPVYRNVNPKIIIKLCSIPIIIMRFFNRERIVHTMWYKPCEQINHDIFFHGFITHLGINWDIKGFKKNNIEKIEKIKYSEIFTRNNFIINELYKYFNYDDKSKDITDIKNKENIIIPHETKITYDLLDPNSEIIKIINCLILFYSIHENPDYKFNFKLIDLCSMEKIEEDWNNYFKFTNNYKNIDFTSFQKQLQIVINNIQKRIINNEKLGITVYKGPKQERSTRRKSTTFSV